MRKRHFSSCYLLKNREVSENNFQISFLLLRVSFFCSSTPEARCRFCFSFLYKSYYPGISTAVVTNSSIEEKQGDPSKRIVGKLKLKKKKKDKRSDTGNEKTEVRRPGEKKNYKKESRKKKRL